uniref:Transposase (Putative), gypsy type n=1 Tax=Tanacetum cinerariifolium TaxID=118510 RepID=A0A6L2N3P3_TANCI|nr:hypothetical protein [Tanacetum cinerariifolium]
MDLFAFIHHGDPTMVRIGEKQIEAGQTLLLDSTKGCVVSLAVGDDQARPSVSVGHGDHNDDVDNVGTHDLNEESDDVELKDQIKEGVHVVQAEGVNILADDEIQAIVVDKPKGTRRKRKAASGASGSVLPLKKLKEYHGTSSDVGSSTAGKSLAALQDLLDRSNLAAEVGVTAAATVPFVTSYVTLTLEHKGNVEVSIARAGTGPAIQSLFANSASPSAAGLDTAGPSDPYDICSKWNLINNSSLDDPYVATCLSVEVKLRSEHNLRERKMFERKCARQIDLLKEKDAKIANLKARLTLKEAEAAEAIRLRGQVSIIESAEASRVGELSSLKEQDSILKEEKGVLDGKKDNLTNQVSLLETTCSGLRDQTGLVAGIDHGKAGRGLADVAAYDPSAKTKYVSAVLAFRKLDFDFLVVLESQKDASIVDIMDHFRLEGPFAETPEISQLQPSHEHLLLRVHRTKDNVVIGETSLFESLDAVHARVQKVKKGASSHCLSIYDAMGPLVNPLSFENLVGEVSTSGVPITVTVTTALSTTFAHTSSVPCISVADYGMLDVEHHPEASPFPKVIFEQETLEISLKHPATTSVPYVSENEVSPLLDLIMVRLLFALFTKPLACGCLTDASFASIHFVNWSMDTIKILTLSDLSGKDGELGNLGILISLSLRLYAWLASAIKALYSASLLVSSNWNLRAQVNFVPFGFVSIRPALEPSTQDVQSVNSIHGSRSSSSTSMGVPRESSSGRSTMKSAKIFPLIDILGTANEIYWHLLPFSFGHQNCAHGFSGCYESIESHSSLCISIRHFGDGKPRTASTLSGQTFIPLVFTLYPRNMPSSIPKRTSFSDVQPMLHNVLRNPSYVLSPETIVHSSGIILLLCSVSIPSGTGNFNIP